MSIRGTKHGVLKYIGKIHINDGIWCGIKLDGPLGKHNGKIEGVRYFRCQHRFGIFAPLRHVEKMHIEPRQSRVFVDQSDNPRSSFRTFHEPSSPDSNDSEFSSSSTSLNHFAAPPSRPMADSAAHEKALSSEITNLMDKIRQKDRYIEELQRQNGRDRLELSHTKEKMDEMDINILALQQQSDLKDQENEVLQSQQIELQQRIEDLQFELEECQYHASDAAQLAIPDDHRLLSPEEVHTYEKTKAKVAELQSINNNLSQQNQAFQGKLARHHELAEKEKQTDQLIEQLKKQIEVLKAQLADLQRNGTHRCRTSRSPRLWFVSLEQTKASQLMANETSHKQQTHEYQRQVDALTSEAQSVSQNSSVEIEDLHVCDSFRCNNASTPSNKRSRPVTSDCTMS